MRLILAFLLFPYLLFAEEAVSHSSRQEADPTEMYFPPSCNSNYFSQLRVDPISGSYFDHEVDLVLASSQPLSVRRFYSHISSGQSLAELRWGHWMVNPEIFMYANFNTSGYKTQVILGESSGSIVSYEKGEKTAYYSGTYDFDPSQQQSFTNISGDQICGQDHPLNTQINYNMILDPKEKKNNRYMFVGSVTDGAGAVKFFGTKMHRWSSDVDGVFYAKHWTPYPCEIAEERLPNGNHIVYSWDRLYDDCDYPTAYLVTNISLQNSVNEEIGNIAFAYHKRIKHQEIGGKKREFGWVESYTALGSDGRAVLYYHEIIPGSNNARYDVRLTQAKAPGKPLITYEYMNGVAPFLERINFPNGSYLKNYYFHVDGPGIIKDDSTFADWKVSAQSAPLGANDEEIPIATYSYLDGKTEVLDALSNKITYYYEDKKITAIEKEDIIENNVWDSSTGNLRCKYFQDTIGNIVSATKYLYDEQHNVTEEKLYGNLTGQNQQSIQLGDDNLPLENGVECYTIYRTYSDNKFNLKTSEEDYTGKRTDYIYKPDTNLLLCELVYDDTRIRKRTFYDYDKNATLIKKIIDDGINKDPTDLLGITYRLITEIQPIESKICFGLPKEIIEKTINSTGEEILLKRTSYTYTPFGKVEQEDHYDCNNVYRYSVYNEYDPETELLISTKDPLGNILCYAYNDSYQLTSQKGPSPNQLKTWTYDLGFRPIQLTDGNHVTTQTFDPLGNLIEKTDPYGHTTHYTYDSSSRVIQINHPDGGVESKEYDLFGNVLKETDQNGYTTYIAYNIRGKPTHVLYPDETEESFVYNLNGTLAEKIDKNGAHTIYSYDTFGNIVKEEIYAKDATLLKSISASYTPFCKLSETDPKGITTHFSYDFSGRKIAEKKSDRLILFSYDELGRLNKTRRGETFYREEHDFLNHVIEKRTEDQYGNVYFQENYLYDSKGNQTHVITCEGTSETVYNSLNDPIKHIDASGNVTRIDYSLDPEKRITTTDPLGIQIIKKHDPCQRLQEVKTFNLQGECIQHREFCYDLAGNQIEAIEHVYEGSDPSQTTSVKWIYGPNNRLERLIESDLKETAYLYDAHGRQSTLIKPDQTQILHTYDDLGRLLTLSSSTGEVKYTYTYDESDNVTSVYDTFHDHYTTRAYDSYGSIIQEKLGNGFTINREFDQEGRLVKLTLPDKTHATFSYRGGYLFSIHYQNQIYTYENRNLSGKPTQTHLPASLGNIRLTYDLSLRWKSFISPYFSAVDYQYDPVGNLTQYTFTDARGIVSCGYEYDDLHQLIGENEHTYSYDSLNNRVQKDELRHIVNSLSQITHDGEIEYQYDPNGNLIQAGESYFTYDALDRLITVQSENKIYEYTYDSFNRRLSKKTLQETVNFFWDDKNEIGSSKGELRILGEGFGAEIGAAVFIKLRDELFVPIHDQRGAVVSLIDLKRHPKETYRYTAFGEELDNGTLSPWRFASKRVDEETGYLYFGRRYYSPNLGRWISPDPMGFEDGPNLYAYVDNNPLINIDEYGLFGLLALSIKAPAIFSAITSLLDVAFELALPCTHALVNLGPGAPLWQQTLLSAGVIFDVFTLVGAPMKMAGTGALKGAYYATRLGRVAANAEHGVQIAKGAEKVVGKKLAEKAAVNTTLRAEAGASRLFIEHAVENGGLSAFEKASEYGILKYKELRKLINGTGLQAHHLIEKRFASVLEVSSPDMLSVALTKEEHLLFTKAWRRAISYGKGTVGASEELVYKTARKIYKDYPEFLKALGL